MKNLLILGLIIILFISLIYKVYNRKTKEGNTNILNKCDLSAKGKVEKEILVNNWVDVTNNAKEVIDYYKNDDCNIEKDEDEKIKDARNDQNIALKVGITTSNYYEKNPNDNSVEEEKANYLAYEENENQPEKVEQIKEEKKEKRYTARDFVNINCNVCDDIGENCALYYDNGESELSIYYKDPWSLETYRVFDEFNEKNLKNEKGKLIKSVEKCKEIKKLEKCKNVNSCVDIRGSAENRENCLICERPISNGRYTIKKEYPYEHETESHEIKVQNGFPLDWESKGYKCESGYGPFNVEGCQRGACAEDSEPPGPNSNECYAELYSDNGGVGEPSSPEWWKKNETKKQPITFNGYVEESENNKFKWTNPDEDDDYQSIVANISDKTNVIKDDYTYAKKSYIFKNGEVDKNNIQDFACSHQERTGKANIDCQLKKEREKGMKTDAIGSFYKQKYNIENFSNIQEGYACTNTSTANYVNSELSKKIKDHFNTFISQLGNNFSSALGYENKLGEIENIKKISRGDKKQAALQVFGEAINNGKPKKGDHVMFRLNEQVVKGVIVEIENKIIKGSPKTMALCIWDYFKDKNDEYYRRGYSVCNEETFKSKNPNEIYNNSDCVDGITSYFDIGETNCTEGNKSCELSNEVNYTGNLGSYKNMSGSLMENMIEKSNKYSEDEKKLWKEEGWINIDELERLHICQKQKCKKGYFSCENTANNYINL